MNAQGCFGRDIRGSIIAVSEKLFFCDKSLKYELTTTSLHILITYSEKIHLTREPGRRPNRAA
jgi:hypothetical protein